MNSTHTRFFTGLTTQSLCTKTYDLAWTKSGEKNVEFKLNRPDLRPSWMQ